MLFPKSVTWMAKSISIDCGIKASTYGIYEYGIQQNYATYF